MISLAYRGVQTMALGRLGAAFARWTGQVILKITSVVVREWRATKRTTVKIATNHLDLLTDSTN